MIQKIAYHLADFTPRYKQGHSAKYLFDIVVPNEEKSICTVSQKLRKSNFLFIQFLLYVRLSYRISASFLWMLSSLFEL